MYPFDTENEKWSFSPKLHVCMWSVRVCMCVTLAQMMLHQCVCRVWCMHVCERVRAHIRELTMH